MLLHQVPAESTRNNNDMVGACNGPFLQQFQRTPRLLASLAQENVFLGNPAVVIEDDPVTVEGPRGQRECSRIEVVRMHHANGILPGYGAGFHEESGEFITGDCGMRGAIGHLELVGMAIKEQKKRVQAAGGIEVMEFAQDSGAVARLMREIAVGEYEIPAWTYARVRIAAVFAITRSAAALPLSIESSIEKYSHRPYRPAANISRDSR